MLPSLCWEIIDVGALSDFVLLEESQVMLEVGVGSLEVGFFKVVAQGLAWMDTTARMTPWRPVWVAELVLVLAPQGTREVQLPTEGVMWGPFCPAVMGHPVRSCLLPSGSSTGV